MGQIPEIRQVRMHFDEIAHLGIGKPQITHHFIQREAQGQPHGIAHRIAHIVHNFAHETRPVFQRSTVFVGPVVGDRGQEMLENPEPVRAIKTDQVKPCSLRPLARVHEPAAQVADVLFVHAAGIDRVIGKGPDRHAGHGQRHFARVEIGPVDAGIGQLDAGQRTARFHRFGHSCDAGNILIFPQPQLDERGNLGRVVHFALFGEHHTPAAFGLDPAHGGSC